MGRLKKQDKQEAPLDGATKKKATKKKGRGKKKTRRERGSGGLTLRGRIWHIKFYVGGQEVRESTGKTDKQEAQNILNERLAAVGNGTYGTKDTRKAKIADLFPGIEQNYRFKGYTSLGDIQNQWHCHLKPAFGHILACNLTTDKVNTYKNNRLDGKSELGTKPAKPGEPKLFEPPAPKLAEPAMPATINRELSTLRRMYTLGMEAKPPKVQQCPKIEKLAENNIRTGFLEDADFFRLSALCALVGIWLHAIIEVGYTFGWRISEVLKLRVRQVDLAGCCIRLDPGTTKNKEGRVAKFGPHSKLAGLLKQCCAGKDPDDPLFTREDGSPVKSITGIWHEVCCEAGLGHRHCRRHEVQVRLDRDMVCPICKVRIQTRHSTYVGLLFHDLRRSMARHQRRMGTSEKTIKTVGGWKTNSVFERYNIIDERDLDDFASNDEERRAQFGRNQTESAPGEVQEGEGKEGDK